MAHRLLRNNLSNSHTGNYLLPAILVITILIYYPALQGRFYLDDTYNLAGLSDIATYGLAHFVLEGFAGPAGRPLSLLSFALQYKDWPGNPAAFKLVNLIIHLINGVLLWFLSKRLIQATELKQQYQLMFVMLCTFMWLIHPIQMSTVLYVVQRMTQLSTFFTLLGILGYLHMRERVLSHNSSGPMFIMSLIIYGCIFLGVLCKENAILLPLYIFTIEATLFAGSNKTIFNNKRLSALLALPIVILIVYLGTHVENVLASYTHQAFTLEQRLLTEPGVLLTYLKIIIMPSYGAFSLYHDDYPVSSGLLLPPVTLVAVIIVISLLFAAILFRKRVPVLSFAILWFYSGHVLESTYLNLEIYYEHRNYLPIFGIIFGLNGLICLYLQQLRKKFMIAMLSITYYVLILGISTVEARTWSQPLIQALMWAETHPDSVRAMDDLAAVYTKVGDNQRAIKVYDRLAGLKSDEMYPLIRRLEILICQSEIKQTNEQWNIMFIKAQSSTASGMKIVAAMDSLVGRVVGGNCPAMEHDKLLELVLILSRNPDYSQHLAFLYENAATLSAYSGRFQDALDYIRKALHYAPTLSNHIYEIRLLKLTGEHVAVQKKINEIKDRISANPGEYFAYKKIIESLEVR